MRIITSAQMKEAVGALKQMGVRFPKGFPPANLSPGSSEFRGVWSELETLALLVRVIEPDLLELAEREKGRDTDIVIRLSPPYRLQVKGPLVVKVDPDCTVDQLVRSARMDALKRFRAENPHAWKGVFSVIKISMGNGKRREYSGASFSVNFPRKVHAAVVQVNSDVMAAMARRNLDRWIRDAVRQLVKYEDALLIPVLNVSRYPLNQAESYKLVKKVFRRHPRWKCKISGVILILRGYGKSSPVTGFHASNLRLIGIENPLAPEGRRLKTELFRPNVEEEITYDESPVVISVDPPSELYRIENGQVWLGSTLFGALPGPLGEPFMTIF